MPKPKPKKPRPADRNFQGEIARRWRRQVAANAKSKFTSTLKFPLDPPPGGWDFDQAQELHSAVAGISRGSLVGLLCAVHLSGFRLYHRDIWETGAYQPLPAAEFRASLQANYPDFAIPPGLTPQKIKEWLVSGFRNATFCQEWLAEKFIKDFKLGTEPHRAIQDLTGAVAGAIVETFSDFAGLSSEPQHALSVVRESLAEIAIDFPTDNSPVAPNDLPQKLKKPTIAFFRERNCPPEIDGDVALHQAVALAARDGRAENKDIYDEDKKDKKYIKDQASDIQSRFTGGAKSSGLSWLFGAGWEMFTTHTVAELAQWLPSADGNPVPERCIERVQKYAGTLPGKPPFLSGLSHYAEFRQQVGGSLNSWIANYWQRLHELKEGFAEAPDHSFLPKELQDARACEILESVGLTAASVDESVRQAAESHQNGLALVCKFLGENEELPTADDKIKMDAIAATIQMVYAELKQIKKMAGDRVKEAGGEPSNDSVGAEINESDSEEVRFWKMLNGLNIPTWLKKPRKLNKYSGGAIPAGLAGVQEEIGGIAARFSSLLREWQAYGEQLADECDQTRPLAQIAPDLWRRAEILAEDLPGGRGSQTNGRTLLLQTSVCDLSESAMSPDDSRLIQTARDTARFLHKLGMLARRMDGANKNRMIKVLAPHFADCSAGTSKECHKFVHNNQGVLWRSGHARRHDPWALKESAFAEDWGVKLLEIADELWRNMETVSEYRASLRDWLELRRLLFVHQLETLGGGSAKVPQEKARPGAFIAGSSGESRNRMRAHWELCLQQDNVPANVCKQMFNLYVSELRGMLFALTRASFILRVSFQPIIGSNKPSFVQTPKAGEWNVPDRLHKSVRPVSAALSSLETRQLYANGRVQTEAAHAHITSLPAEKLTAEARAAYFSQAPHEWHLALPWMAKDFPAAAGLKMNKDGKIMSAALYAPYAAVRICGPASYKNRIVQTLLGKWKAGEHSLIVEQKYQISSLQWRNGALTATIEEDRPPSAYGAVPFSPVSDEQKPESPGYIWDNIVAIDLGERGIGYAVFDIREFLQARESTEPDNAKMTDEQFCQMWNSIIPRCRGNIPVPAIRALIRAAGRHRKIAQPRQRMQQSYSSALAERRAATIGQARNAIEKLCRDHRAFPVLEREVSGFESGGKQLSLVYGSIVRSYTYSDVPAHRDARKHHWLGGFQWKHAFLSARETYDDRNKKYTGEAVEDFKLYPGATVRAGGTSQICSCCGRNPFDPLRNSRQGSAPLPAGRFNNGIVAWDGGHIRLYEKSVKDGGGGIDRNKRSHNRLKLRLPWWKNPVNGKKDEKALRTLLKFNARRPSHSTRSRDTTQARYFCVFADCPNHWPPGAIPDDPAQRRETQRHQRAWDNFVNFSDPQARQREWGVHADENAAVNIGRRFLAGEPGRTPKLHRQKSLEKLRKNEKGV